MSRKSLLRDPNIGITNLDSVVDRSVAFMLPTIIERPTTKSLQAVKKHHKSTSKTLGEIYKYISRMTNDCLWDWNLKTDKIFWIDEGHKRAFGYSTQNNFVSKQFWENSIHKSDRERVVKRLKQALAERKNIDWDDQYRFRKKNGKYAYVHDRAHIICDQKGEPIRMIGATQDITTKVLLKKKLDKLKKAKHQNVTGAVFTLLENEREKIGKALHENIGQVLAATKLSLQLTLKTGKNWQQDISKTLKYLGDMMLEVNRISDALTIPEAHILGLNENIENLIALSSGIRPLKINFLSSKIDEESLDKKLQVTIIRIIQDQLNYIVHSSAANKVNIELSRKENNLILIIIDNGIGCDPLKRKKSAELDCIKSRTEMNDGTITMSNQPGKCYSLKAIFPLAKTTAAKSRA